MRIFSLLNSEYQPRALEVEYFSQFQVPQLILIGLPGPEIQESKERVRAAIETSGFEFPKRKIVLNLTPPGIRKSGTGLDLALAVSILAHSVQKQSDDGLRLFCWGELSLNGEIHPAPGAVRAVIAALEAECRVLFFPKEDLRAFQEAYALLQEARDPRLKTLTFIPAANLKELLPKLQALHRHGVDAHIEFQEEFKAKHAQAARDSKERSSEEPALETPAFLDAGFAEALGVALSGHHHLLLLGSKGTGKTTTLRHTETLLPSLPPPLRLERHLLGELALESASRVRWISALVRPAALTGHALTQSFKPGDFSLAHGGALIADEFLEWSRDAREALREPLESGTITLTRAKLRARLPARFLFLGSANLCPCGERKDLNSDCVCKRDERERYWKRLSGPIRDRIDLVWIQSHVGSRSNRTPLSKLKARIQETRDRLARAHGIDPGLAPPALAETWCERLGLALEDHASYRERHKLARLAVTFAAWEGRDQPERQDLLKAKLYRIDRVV